MIDNFTVKVYSKDSCKPFLLYTMTGVELRSVCRAVVNLIDLKRIIAYFLGGNYGKF